MSEQLQEKDAEIERLKAETAKFSKALEDACQTLLDMTKLKDQRIAELEEALKDDESFASICTYIENKNIAMMEILDGVPHLWNDAARQDYHGCPEDCPRCRYEALKKEWAK